jgi:hypothetical protein
MNISGVTIISLDYFFPLTVTFRIGSIEKWFDIAEGRRNCSFELLDFLHLKLYSHILFFNYGEA